MNYADKNQRSIVSSLMRSRSWGLGFALGLMALVAMADYLTGRDLQVVPLYLLPVGIATWVGGGVTGVLFALLSACAWLAGELVWNASYLHPFEPYWNAAGLLLTFSVVTWILTGLRNSLISLEGKVEQRTAALRHEMLMRHEAEEGRLHAERLAAAGTMAAQVAHEVRNPLGSITLNLDLLMTEIGALAQGSSHSAEEARFLVSQFRQEVARIKQVVDGYMLLARMPKLEAHLFPLNDFLSRKLTLAIPELEAAKVQLVKDFDNRIGEVEADSDKLWQVLVNLIRNARQAMPEGGRLTLCTKKLPAELHIVVSDTGEGIPPESLGRLFTPFFTTKPDGTGLGLVLVRQIIGEMGGRITCQSTLGQGTAFTLSFPLLVLGIEPEATLSPPSAAPKPRLLQADLALTSP